MGIFDALTTAVAGLQAQSFALQNISGNIANSQTTGFKETDTSFQDLVSQAALNEQTAGGVIASSVATNTVQGSIQSTSVATDMAINGAGFFVVAKPTGLTDNQPQFSGVNDYTRAGDFQMNSSGYLVNSAGYYLMGIPVDADHWQSRRQRSAGPAVQQQFHSGAGDDLDQLRGQPAEFADVRPDRAGRFRQRSGRRSGDTRHRGNDFAGRGGGRHRDGLQPDQRHSAGGRPRNYKRRQNHYRRRDHDDQLHCHRQLDRRRSDQRHQRRAARRSTASLSNGNLKLTGDNDTAVVSITDNNATVGTDATLLGFGTGNNSFNPTNLMTQGLSGTLSVSVGGGSPQTITIGTGAGDVETLSQLQTAVQGLSGVIGTVNTQNGNISLVATDPTATLAVTGTGGASPSAFGIQTTTVAPGNGTVIGSDLSTFTSQSIDGGSITAYDADGNPLNVQFRWAQVASANGQSMWNLYYQTNSERDRVAAGMAECRHQLHLQRQRPAHPADHQHADAAD